jgi:4-amino-4-deoxy-L-arabinose transferase-like glycosyltransferase
MKKITSYLSKNDWVFYLIAVMLILPALFYNLGLMPLKSDGGLRGMITYEMILNGDLLTPTQYGELYFNKPPLYNWIVAFFFWITGSYSDYVIKLPVVVSTLFFGLTIFLFLKNEYGKRFAAINAFVFMSCGYMFYNGTLVGLIDITYSWVTYMGFMFIYHCWEKGRTWNLFIVSYVFAAAGFLLKGMPTILFQGFTLIVFFIYQKQFKRLFSLAHLVGIMVFILLVGSYYYAYLQKNAVSVEELFKTLWTQSAERTPIEFGFWKSVEYFVLFPLRFLYELLPWSLIFVVLFRKGLWRKVMNKPILKFSVVVFLVNIVVYWISPGNNPRYIIMFFPLALLVFLHFYSEDANPKLVKAVDWIFQVLMVLVFLAVFALPFIKETSIVPNVWLKTIVTAGFIGVLSVLYFKLKSSRLIIFAIVVILIRFTYNWAYIPYLSENIKEARYADYGREVGKITKGEPLYLYSWTPLNEDLGMYAVREREEIIRKNSERLKDKYYIINDFYLNSLKKEGENMEVFYEFETRHKRTKLYLVKFR